MKPKLSAWLYTSRGKWENIFFFVLAMIAAWLGRSTTLAQTVISHQILDGLLWHFVQIGYIPLTLTIPCCIAHVLVRQARNRIRSVNKHTIKLCQTRQDEAKNINIAIVWASWGTLISESAVFHYSTKATSCCDQDSFLFTKPLVCWMDRLLLGWT